MTSGNTKVNFPVSFVNYCIAVITPHTTNRPTFAVGAKSITGITIVRSAVEAFEWITIGY